MRVAFPVKELKALLGMGQGSAAAPVAVEAPAALHSWDATLTDNGSSLRDLPSSGSGREAGDFGFDPVGFGSNPEKMKDLQMKELANGRLAMFAFGGMVTQSVLTGNSFPYLFGDATTFGSGGDFAWNVVAGFGGAAAGY